MGSRVVAGGVVGGGLLCASVVEYVLRLTARN